MENLPKLSYDEIEQKLEVQEALVECIQTLFSKDDDFGVSINNLLSIIADYYCAERAFIFQFEEDDIHMRNAYEWVSEDSEATPDNFKEYTIDSLREWFSLMEEQGELFIDVDTLSLEEGSVAWNFVSAQKIRKLIVVPLTSEGKTYGFIGVKNFLREDVSSLLLQSVATFVLNDFKQRDSFEHKIFQSVTEINLSMYLVNVIDDNFSVLKTCPQINQKFADDGGSARTKFPLLLEGIVAADYLPALHEFCNFDTLEERFADHKILNVDFLSVFSEWFRASFSPVSRNYDGKLKYVVFSIQQIDEEKRRELEYQQAVKSTLENQNEVYSEILQSQSAGVLSFKRVSKEILIMNPAALNMFGWDIIVSANGNITAILDKIESNEKDEIIQKILNLQRSDLEYTFEFALHRAENDLRWILGHVKVVVLSNHEEIVIISFTDITSNKKMETELFYLSQTDGLTKILNRGSGERRIEYLLKKGMCGMFCLFDVDKFKAINDNFGHSVGDEVLVEIAKCMKRSFRGNDIVMRLGGDEFAIFALSVQDEKIGAMCIERFFSSVHGISIKPLRDRKVSVSLGAVFTEGAGESFDQLYQRADELLYTCKKLPGCQYSFYHKIAGKNKK